MGLDLLLTQSAGLSPVGNVLVMAICILLIFLLADSFSVKDKSFMLFFHMLVLCFFATIIDQTYILCERDIEVTPEIILYLLKHLYHVILFLDMFIYIYYLSKMLLLKKNKQILTYAVSIGIIVIMTVTDTMASAASIGFHIIDGIADEGLNLFPIGYALLSAVILGMVFVNRKRMIPQVMHGVSFTYILCVILMFIQGLLNHSAFTTAVFLLPVISLMYLLHSNPYEPATGAINEASFAKTIHEASRSKEPFKLIVLYSKDIESTLSFTPELKFEIYHFFSNITKKAVLFRIAGDKLALYFSHRKNPDPEGTTQRLIDHFSSLYARFNVDFKVIIMDSNDDFNKNNEYNKFLSFIEDSVPMNSFYQVTEDDINRYKKERYIIEQLENISRYRDLNDARILTYCQPVFNVNSKQYDTAEALMRLTLPETGLVIPDTFIPLAEKHGFIHALSCIILNKTCIKIKEFINAGLYINRISVNFSISELRDPDFSKDILAIIDKNGIPHSKIAIEITESRDESDFNIIKERIHELQAYGIKFYLDDFGTGYSNFDRIMELPFDIIKFDRSLVIESGKNQNSKYMVNSFADMFHKLNYKVLYEGVENTDDEERCIKMLAQYLQGYKYSKPIPIDLLKNFLTEESA